MNILDLNIGGIMGDTRHWNCAIFSMHASSNFTSNSIHACVCIVANGEYLMMGIGSVRG